MILTKLKCFIQLSYVLIKLNPCLAELETFGISILMKFKSLKKAKTTDGGVIDINGIKETT
jgi:hypothetical protein